MKSKQIDEVELTRELQDIYKRTGKKPLATDWPELYQPAKRIYGGWERALDATGVTALIRQDTLRQLERYMKLYNRPPKLRGTPEERTLHIKIAYQFGSIERAIELLNAPPERPIRRKYECGLPSISGCKRKNKNYCCQYCQMKCEHRCANKPEVCGMFRKR